jgi:hypothetical protein
LTAASFRVKNLRAEEREIERTLSFVIAAQVGIDFY